MKKTIAATLVLMSIGLLAFYVWDRTEGSAEKRLPTGSESTAEKRRAAPQAHSSSVRSASLPTMVRSEATDQSRFLLQLSSRRGWPELQAQVMAAPHSAERAYVLAELYWQCAKRDGAGSDNANAKEREQLIRAISGSGDTQASRRLAALDRASVDPCAGVDMGNYSNERMLALRKEAIDAGSPTAVGWAISSEIGRTAAQARARSLHVSEAQFEALRAVLASGEASAVQEVQHIFGSSLDGATVRLENQSVDIPSFHAALSLVACDLGAFCGADRREMLLACAREGRCGASNYPDHVFLYEVSPANAPVVERYRSSLRAMIGRGDMSGLSLLREGSTAGHLRAARRYSN